MNFIFPLIIIITVSACRRDDIEVRQVSKESASSSSAMPAMGMGPSGSMPQGAIEALPPAQALRWTLPSGWKEEPGNGIRLATLRPPQDAGPSEVSVVALPGDVGGELPNVNRWRGQLGLPPINAPQLPKARQKTHSRLGEVLIYDFTGAAIAKPRMIVGVLKVEDTTWFFKLTGEDAVIGKHKKSFVKLLEGLKHDAS